MAKSDYILVCNLLF